MELSAIASRLATTKPQVCAKRSDSSQSFADAVLALPTRANAARQAFEAGGATGSGLEATAMAASLIDRALQYQKEYRAARTPAELDEVNARYADLFGGRIPPAASGVDFDKHGKRMAIDGEKVGG